MEMLKKKVLIFGSDGIIGNGIRNDFHESNFVDFYSRMSLTKKFDLNHLNEFNLNEINSESIILFLSAVSRPAECENLLNNSYEINVLRTIEAIDKLLNKGAHVIFSSSDTVYGGSENLKFNEDHQVNPKSKYSEWKVIVEEKFINHENFSVIRFSQCINLFDSFSNYISNSIKNETAISILNNYYRNIFDQELLSLFIMKLTITNEKFKILNFGSDLCENRSSFFNLIKDKISDIKLEEFNPNNRDKITKIFIDNSRLKSYLNIKEISFNYENWLDKILNKIA